MRTCSRWIVGAFVAVLPALTARAAVHVSIDRNDNEHASADFKFSHVPSPTQGSAFAKASVTLIDGRRDRNGGELRQLTDGLLPDSGDDPADNFFFTQQTDGGRLLADLGAPIDIARIDTYSWHPGTRGPQVYKLYAADGSAKGFDLKPNRTVDLQTRGWTLLADVDTRPKVAAPGGQYGVSLTDPGKTLGKYRYLLFDISRTESDDPFGNTFFSAIDVIDRNAPPATQPAGPPRFGPNLQYQIYIDTSRAPQLSDWAEHRLRPVLQKWYPIIVAMLPSKGFEAPARFKITFMPGMKGVAYTLDTRVVCAVPWFERNLKGEAIGAVVHEMVHVVQQYHLGHNPSWLVEGMADYVRWFKYEPASKRPRPNPRTAKYTDSYRTSAAFLNYVAQTHDKNIVGELNASIRTGQYTPETWTRLTGHTAQELWEQYVAALSDKNPRPATRAGGK